MSAPFQRNQADILGNSALPSVTNAALALKDTLNKLPSNGHVMQEERIGSAGASEARAARSSAKQTADSWKDDTWDILLASEENSIRTYLECRFSELKVRKRDNEKTISRLQRMMDDSLMQDLGDFKHRVMNEERLGPLREYFLEQCSIFECSLQQPSHKPPTDLQEPKLKKLKVSDLHQTKVVPKIGGADKSHEIHVDHNKDAGVNSHQTEAAPNRDQVVNSRQTEAAPNRDQVVNSHETPIRPSTDASSHDTKATSNTDQQVHIGPWQTPGGILVRALTVDEQVQGLQGTSTGNKSNPLIDHQDLPTTAGKEIRNADNVCRNIGQELIVTSDAGCNQSPANSTRDPTRDLATNTQEDPSRDPGTNTQDNPTRDPGTNTQDNLARNSATNTQEEAARDPATYAQDNPARDSATNTQEEASREPATYAHGKAAGAQADDQEDVSTSHNKTNSQQTASTTLEARCLAHTEVETERVVVPGDGAVRTVDATTITDDCYFGQTPEVLQTQDAPDSVDLLLIGSCGNGKSATGNSILGQAVFQRSASSSVAAASSASSIRMASTEIAGQLVNVVDGPSINLCGNITPEELDKVTHNILRALELCKFAFNALVIVLKFGNRFTKQEMEALRVIKAVLGADVIREFGVCVITFGDSFDHVVEEAREDGEELTFDSWLKGQTGQVTKLLEECMFRYVLFDNVTKDGSKRLKQLETLMHILPKGKRYSQDAFLEACEGTHQLQVEANLPRFLKEARTEAEKLKERIEQAEETKQQDPEARMLSSKLSELKAKVYTVTAKSGELESLKLFLQLLEAQLSNKIKHWRIERHMDKNTGVPGQALVDAVITPPLMPLEFTPSTSKTSCSSAKGSHVVSVHEPMRCSPHIDTTSVATRYLKDTQVKGQGTRSPANIDNFQIVDGSARAGDNASIAEMIKKRVKDFVNGL